MEVALTKATGSWLKDCWGNYVNKRLFEVLGMFDPSSVCMGLIERPPDQKELKELFPACWTDVVHAEYVVYVETDNAMLREWGKAKDFWGSERAAKDFPLLSPIVSCIETIPVSVTQVDSSFASLRAFMNALKGNTKPAALRRKFMMYRNKDVVGRLTNCDEDVEDVEDVGQPDFVSSDDITVFAYWGANKRSGVNKRSGPNKRSG